MKLSKITLLVLMASLAATGCGKRKLAEKASEDPKPDPLAVTSATKDDAKEAFKGPLSIGVNEKYGKLMAAYNGDPAKATLKLTAAYTPASKKLTISKDYSSLRIVSANAEGKSEPLDMKTVKKIPTMTLGQQPVEIQVDEEKKQYVLKADTATDVDVTKAITVGLKSDDEKLKIDETSYELSPIVLLGKPEEQSQELVLDLSKGEVPTDLTLFHRTKVKKAIRPSLNVHWFLQMESAKLNLSPLDWISLVKTA
jgi:hypothetical protein